MTESVGSTPPVVDAARSSVGVFSNSSLGTATDCPHRFRKLYIERVETTVTASYFKIGNIIHTAVENFYDDGEIDKLTNSEASQKDWIKREAQALWVDAFDQELVYDLMTFQQVFDQAVADSQEDFRTKRGRDTKNVFMTTHWKTTYKDQLVALEQEKITPHQKRFPNIRFRKPIRTLFTDTMSCVSNFVELHREAGLDSSVITTEFKADPPVEFLDTGEALTGRIDRLVTLGSPEKPEYQVFDYKTGTARWSLNKVANSDQLNKYAYIVANKFGQLPSKVGIWDLMNKAVIVHEYNVEDLHRWMRRTGGAIGYVRTLEKIIEQGESISEEDVLPIPAGKTFPSLGCPCDLLYEEDPDLRCPYMHDYEIEQDKEQVA